MAASATLMSMAYERKFENLREFMVNLANSKGFSLPETKLFEQKFLDLCLSRTPDHPTYSAMIFVAITELNEEGGCCEEAISEFIKLKYKNLPFAHTSLLSHHLAKLVEKKEILCDYGNNYCYSLPGEKKSVASTDTERNREFVTVGMNDPRVANEVMTRQNEEENVGVLKSGYQNVDLLEEQSLVEFETSPKRKASGGINLIEVRHTEDTGTKACLRESTVESLRIEEVAKEPEVSLVNSETKVSIEANSEGGELYEVVVLDEQNDVVMEESDKGEEKLMDISSEQRKVKLGRKSDTTKEECVEVTSEAYKTLWECQTDACGSITALEKMMKQCRKKDQQNKAVSGIDDVSCLPLSMESCKGLRRLAHKIESQLSEIIDSIDEAVVPCIESRECDIEDITKGYVPTITKKRRTSCGSNRSEMTSKQLEQKEREIDSQEKPKAKKSRVGRLQDRETRVVRKSPRGHKPT